MRVLPFLCVLCAFASLRFQTHAQTPPPKLPLLTDPALRLEVFATYPEVEAPTTVTAAPDGSVYVGCDPRDTRLNTAKPECFIVRFGDFDTPDQIRLPDGTLAPPGPPHRHRTVFADKLYSPAGSAWHDGWLYVIHAPLMSRFRDTDGDGIADLREDLITNLGLPPYEGLNDHVVSGFTLGMDGFFYISVGDRGVYKARGRDGSELTLRGGGIIRCRPDGTQLAIYSTGTRNHLSVALDAEDHAFTLDNTDDGNGWWTRLTHHIEGGYYGYPHDYQKVPNYGVTQPSPQTLDAMKQRAGGNRAVDSQSLHGTDGAVPSPFLPAMTDFGPGSPTGGLCYLSDGLPEPYRGKLFFSEWGRQNVSVIEVAREGATFRFVKNTPLVQGGAGVDFRPMQLSVAADGSLLIADWQWGGWKGPKTTGTIWRVSWPEAHPAPRLPDESKASVEELIAALGHADRDQRLRAQTELVKRAASEVTSLPPGRAWLKAATIEKIGRLMDDQTTDNTQRMHALWAWTALAKAEEVAFRAVALATQNRMRRNLAFELTFRIGQLSKDPKAALRAQALRAARQGQVMMASYPLGAQVMSDTDAAVRLQAATSLGRYGMLTEKFLPLLDDADPWVRFATRAALRERIAAGWPRISSERSKEPAEIVAAALSRESAWQFFPSSLDPRVIRGGGDAKSEASIVRLGEETLKLLQPPLVSTDAATRARAITALGAIAYQPKPYDGHWWGTQPVKNPPPPHSVAWAGTAKALEALTAALSDPDPAVRLAAAKALAVLSSRR